MDARSAGLLRYFTGTPCANGHVSERQVSSGNCLACSAARKRVSRAGDPKKHASQSQAWIEANRDHINSTRRERNRKSDKHRKGALNWYYRNREAILLRKRAHRAANKEIYNQRQRAKNAADPTNSRHNAKMRQAAAKRAIPSWFSELDDLVWREATDLVALRRSVTGFNWEADHMIPVRAKTASGLHVWNNCQVIPAAMNGAKKNKLLLTEPLEWLSQI